MARVFDVTAASTSVRLDVRGQGEVLFTATNKSGRNLRGRAALIGVDAAAQPWLSLSGDAERDFPTDGVQQFGVKVAVPAGTKPGQYKFRLDVVSVANPDEDYAQGPTVAADVPLIEPDGHFRWWIPAVALGVVLVVGGVLAWAFWPPPMKDVPNVMMQPAEKALRTVTERGFTVERDDKEDPNVTEARVIAQDPAEGQAKKGSVLKLTVAVPVPPLKLDDYVGKNVKEVRELLEGKFRKVSVIDDGIDSVAAGTIRGQQPGKDAEVKVGDTVTLTVAVPVKPFPMPRVVGESVWKAKRDLEAKGLKVAINDQINPGVPHEQVIEQTPPRDTPVKSGDPVELKYGVTLVTVPGFRPAQQIPGLPGPPRFTGVPWKAAESSLKGVGLALKEVRGSCDGLSGFVTRTNPPGGSAAPQGMAITVFTVGDQNKVCYTPSIVFNQVKSAITNSTIFTIKK